jgi:hypothetical protein
MPITAQDVEDAIKLNGPGAFSTNEKCAICGEEWLNHGDVTEPRGTLAYYARCNTIDRTVGAWKPQSTTFMPVQAAAQNNPTGDVMTDQEVADWVNQASPNSAAFPYNEICTRCGIWWDYHGCVLVGQPLHCVRKSGGIFTDISGTFMPTNLPAGFVRQTQCVPSNTGDVMTNQEVYDWVIGFSQGPRCAFPIKEICTKCGHEWAYHGIGGKNGIKSVVGCVQLVAGSYVAANIGTFMPTNLPAGFVRQASPISPIIATSGTPWHLPAQSAKPKETDLADWRTWRDVNREPDECACGMKRELCEYHR